MLPSMQPAAVRPRSFVSTVAALRADRTRVRPLTPAQLAPVVVACAAFSMSIVRGRMRAADLHHANERTAWSQGRELVQRSTVVALHHLR